MGAKSKIPFGFGIPLLSCSPSETHTKPAHNIPLILCDRNVIPIELIVNIE